MFSGVQLMVQMMEISCDNFFFWGGQNDNKKCNEIFPFYDISVYDETNKVPVWLVTYLPIYDPIIFVI